MATLLISAGQALAGGAAAGGAAAAGAGISLAQGLQVGGTLLSGIGLARSASDQKKAANFNAAQLDAQGKAEQAASIQEAKQANREKELMLSRARAVGAASGGGVDIDLMGEIEEEGYLNEATLLWQGDERRKGRSGQASAAIFDGLNRKRAGMLKAGSTLLSGGASLFEQYG